jgi:hypothetical protein
MEKPKLLSVKEIFDNYSNLTIPDYQRPYKWKEHNVQQLLDDVNMQAGAVPEYRLGTIVLHKTIDSEGNELLNIVDGQQRLITLSLLITALNNAHSQSGGNYFDKYKDTKSCLLSLKSDNPHTNFNVWNNYNLLKRQALGIKEETIQFLFEACKAVWVVIEDVSEAFQFFDSQNSRGKDLEPHDLLKAFHLREMSNNTEKERLECVADWEDMDQEQLKIIFNDYLFRIRNWSKGRSARFFNKSDVHIFKGVSLEHPTNYNFIKPYRINHFYTEKYNSDFDRKIDGIKADYPFQIDQIIINGKRFFEYVSYYSSLTKEISKTHNMLSIENSRLVDNLKQSSTSENSLKILEGLSNYPGKWRTGDSYVRNIFDCCVLYYLDKFGYYKLDTAIEKFFIWTYRDRLEKFSVQLATVDNRGMDTNGFFRIIREAIDTKDIFHKPLDGIGIMNPKNTDKIKELFNELGYWTGNE